MHMLEKVKLRIRPSRADAARAEKIRQFVVGRLEKVVPHDVEIGMMGSVAKGTNLATNRELDIFLLIPRKLTHEQMTKKGLAWAKKAMRGEKTEIGYANHPYLKAHKDGYKIDIVPSYKIENAERLGSAVDRSQLHTSYVNSHLNDSQKDEVRLLKQFAKTLGVYGAELKVEGFSGYLCEILIMQYGSFVGVLEAAAKWGKCPALDLQGLHPKTDLRKMFDAPMIVIDPVDAKRNVSAVVSQTSLSRFIYAARAYLKKPSEEFFFREKEVHSAPKLRAIISSRDTKCLVIFFRSPELVEDILWPQLKKTATALAKAFERAEVRVFGHYFWSDGENALIMFELMDWKLPGVKRCAGPAIWLSKDVELFTKRHSDALNLHLEHERIVAVERRTLKTPELVLQLAVKEGESLGIPAKFLKALRNGKIGGANDLLRPPYLEVASDYFTRRV